jgi:hypothetical protein
VKYKHVAEPVKSGGIAHDVLMSWDLAARNILWPSLAEEGFEPPSAEDFANTTRAMVWEIQRLRQVIAIRNLEDRIEEQIRLGYR